MASQPSPQRIEIRNSKIQNPNPRPLGTFRPAVPQSRIRNPQSEIGSPYTRQLWRIRM